MSQEGCPVEFVLESLESIMAPQTQPKVILFDIGGVCVGGNSLVLPHGLDYTSPRISIFDLIMLYMHNWIAVAYLLPSP